MGIEGLVDGVAGIAEIVDLGGEVVWVDMVVLLNGW